jgi:hypothetical protein
MAAVKEIVLSSRPSKAYQCTWKEFINFLLVNGFSTAAKVTLWSSTRKPLRLQQRSGQEDGVCGSG